MSLYRYFNLEGLAMQEEGYDVYVNEPVFLSEDEEKHLISVFVADESGMINRVAGVFARRGKDLAHIPSSCNKIGEKTNNQ